MFHKEADKAILLLQGPLGPFFSEFAGYLRNRGHEVFKINFNGGDAHYYDGPATNYRGGPNDWRAFLRGYLLENGIGAVIVYGDCRFYHQEAVKLCKELNVKVMVFEEGYLRPDFITLEANGANNYSEMDFRDMESYPEHREETFTVGNTFLQRMRYASIYYNISRFKRGKFSEYQHHRKLNPILEGSCWIRSFVRKLIYTFSHKAALNRLFIEKAGQYYFVPLQVFLDNQLKHHSPYNKISEFIEDVVESFAMYAPKDTHLVIKHHPEDRGHVHYGRLIKRAATRRKIEDRVLYCHELHLPTCLDHAKGVITLNSTVGISSLIHGTPVKTMGFSIMERAGLSAKNSLAKFWNDPGTVDQHGVKKFRNYLMVHGQVNANFYKDIEKGLPLIYRQFYKLLVDNKVNKTVDKIGQGIAKDECAQASVLVTGSGVPRLLHEAGTDSAAYDHGMS